MTQPPRMEGVVKNAGMNQKPKKMKNVGMGQDTATKGRGYTDSQRKDYQLRSKRR